MPPVVGAALALGGGIVLYAAGTGFAITAAGVFLAQAAFGVGLSVLSSHLFAPKLGATDVGLSARATTVRSSIEYRKLVYGRALVSGPVNYHNLSGANGQYAWYALPLSHGECDAIEEVWLDGDAIDAADIDWTAGTGGSDGSGTGAVSDDDWIGENDERALAAFWTTGHSDQVAMSTLVSNFTDWTTAHRGRGIAYGVLRMLYNGNTEKIWDEKGQPTDIAFLVKGRKLYDRRRYALNADNQFVTVGRALGGELRWFADSAQTTLLNSPDFSASGGWLIHSSDTAGGAYSERIPVNTAKRYIVRVGGKNVSGGPESYLGVMFYDSDGDPINSTSTPASDATGWASVGNAHYFEANIQFNPTLTTYLENFGSGGTASIPTGAVEMALVWAANNSVDAGAVSQISDFAVYEYVVPRHSFTDSSTWEWSENPALCLCDYLTQVMSIGSHKIDWEELVQAANDCDAIVNVPYPGGSATESRFTCNGTISLGSTHKQNCDILLSSFDGKLRWKQGKWAIRASTWQDTVATIDEDWLTDSEVSVRGMADAEERFNTINGIYVDPNRKYEIVEFPAVSAAEYVARDAGVARVRELELPMTNSDYMAQRIAYRLLEQGNNQIVVSARLNAKAAQLGVSDTVNVQLWPMGWNDGGNLIDDSSDFSTWSTISGCALTYNDTQGPFGTLDATRITATGGALGGHTPIEHAPDEHEPDQHAASGTSGSATVEVSELFVDAASGVSGNTFAIWMKRGDGNMTRCGVRNDTGAVDLIFADIDANGVATDSGYERNYSRVDHYPNGWIRVLLFIRNGVNDDDDLRVYACSVTSPSGGDYCWITKPQLLTGIHYAPYYVETTGTPLVTTTKTFRVVEWSMAADGTFPVVLREDNEEDYADPEVAEYTTRTGGVITKPALITPAPDDLTATPVPAGILLEWTNPPSRLYEYIEIWVSDTNNRNLASLLAGTAASPYFDERSFDLKNRYYWIRSVNFIDKVSSWEPVSSTGGVEGVPGAPPPLPWIIDPDFDLTADVDATFANAVYWDNPALDGTGAGFSSVVTLLPTSGVNNSACVELAPSDVNAAAGMVCALQMQRRFRIGSGAYELRVRHKTSSSAPFTEIKVSLTCFNAIEGGTVVSTITGLITPTNDAAWYDDAVLLTVTNTDTRSAHIRVELTEGATTEGQNVRIDSLYLYPVRTE